MLLDVISQIVILFTGFTSIFLAGRKNKWGFVMGLAGQPFWFYTTYWHGQWGLFFLNFAYVYVWADGVYHWFFKTDPIINKNL